MLGFPTLISLEEDPYFIKDYSKDMTRGRGQLSCCSDNVSSVEVALHAPHSSAECVSIQYGNLCSIKLCCIIGLTTFIISNNATAVPAIMHLHICLYSLTQ